MFILRNSSPDSPTCLVFIHSFIPISSSKNKLFNEAERKSSHVSQPVRGNKQTIGVLQPRNQTRADLTVTFCVYVGGGSDGVDHLPINMHSLVNMVFFWVASAPCQPTRRAGNTSNESEEQLPQQVAWANWWILGVNVYFSGVTHPHPWPTESTLHCYHPNIFVKVVVLCFSLAFGETETSVASPGSNNTSFTSHEHISSQTNFSGSKSFLALKPCDEDVAWSLKRHLLHVLDNQHNNSCHFSGWTWWLTSSTLPFHSCRCPRTWFWIDC